MRILAAIALLFSVIVADRVRIGGGEITNDGAWMACGGIAVVG